MLSTGWRLTPMFKLTRVTTAFAAVANVWFVVLWTDAFDQEPLPPWTPALPTWLRLIAAAIAGVSLYAFAAALNDILDYRRDRALHPDRPLPSGALSLETAAYLSAATLVTAFLASIPLGLLAAAAAAATAGAVLAYNAFARHLPALGLVALGLTYAIHMLIPNPALLFLAPVWLVMTHSLAVAALSHSVAGRRPPLTGAGAVAIAAGWVFWSTTLAAAAWLRAGTLWPAWVPPAAAIGPSILAGLFALFVWLRLRGVTTSERAADRLTRYGGLWLALYHAGWLLGAGKRTEGLIMTSLAALGFLGMILLREMRGAIEQPLTYRR